MRIEWWSLLLVKIERYFDLSVVLAVCVEMVTTCACRSRVLACLDKKILWSFRNIIPPNETLGEFCKIPPKTNPLGKFTKSPKTKAPETRPLQCEPTSIQLDRNVWATLVYQTVSDKLLQKSGREPRWHSEKISFSQYNYVAQELRNKTKTGQQG